MFGWEFPPHISGGLGTACYGLTKGLAKNDVEVIFVVPKAWGDEDQSSVRLVNAEDVPINVSEKFIDEVWNKIQYMEANSQLIPYITPEDYTILRSKSETERRQHLKNIFMGTFRFSGAYGGSLFEEVNRYGLLGAEIALQHDFDIIHAHDWLTYAAGIAAKKATGKPLVCHIHATEFDRSGENVNSVIYEYERNGMQEADLVMAVSDLTRNTVIKKYGVDPQKVITMHNAVEPNASLFLGLRPKFSEKVVTFLGRITYQKGPEYFVEAAAKVLKTNHDVRFAMAGSGDLLPKIIRRVAQLGIADRFHFTGFLRGQDVDRMLAMSDVFVMPSVSEPFGIVPLEAMRSEVPVVISKQSGVSEILNHALKVDFWDVEAMADAINGLLNYKSLSNFFKTFGKIEVDNLKWEDVAKKIAHAYQELLSHPNIS